MGLAPAIKERLKEARKLHALPTDEYLQHAAIDLAMIGAEWNLETEIRLLVDMAKDTGRPKYQIEAIQELRKLSCAALSFKGKRPPAIIGEIITETVGVPMLPRAVDAPNKEEVDETIRKAINVTRGTSVGSDERTENGVDGDGDSSGRGGADLGAAGDASADASELSGASTGDSSGTPGPAFGPVTAEGIDRAKGDLAKGSPRGRRPPSRIPRGGGLCGTAGTKGDAIFAGPPPATESAG